MTRLEKLLALVLLASVVTSVVRALWGIARWVWFYREALLLLYAVAFVIGLVTIVPVMVAGGLASVARRDRWDPPEEEEDQWATPFALSHPPATMRAPRAREETDHG